MTSVKIVADSIAPDGFSRITSMEVRFPRFIEPEFLRHRMFSFSAASSRAINLRRHITSVMDNSFMPEPFTKDCAGMAAKAVIEREIEVDFCKASWNVAKRNAVQSALALSTLGVHKQHASRLLQPFEYQTYLVTSTEWSNFFELRCPKYKVDGHTGITTFKSQRAMQPFLGDFGEFTNLSTAQPEIQTLAELMYDAYSLSTPKQLDYGEWHLPYGDRINEAEYFEAVKCTNDQDLRLKICSARAARMSYMNHDGSYSFLKDKELADKLLSVGHYSVFEHCAYLLSSYERTQYLRGRVGGKNTEGWCANFKGFKSYRYKLEEEYEITY